VEEYSFIIYSHLIYRREDSKNNTQISQRIMKLTTFTITIMAGLAIAAPTPEADVHLKNELVERAVQKNPKCVACNNAMEACARNCYFLATALIVPCYVGCQSTLISCRNAVTPKVSVLSHIPIELTLIRRSAPLDIHLDAGRI